MLEIRLCRAVLQGKLGNIAAPLLACGRLLSGVAVRLVPLCLCHAAVTDARCSLKERKLWQWRIYAGRSCRRYKFAADVSSRSRKSYGSPCSSHFLADV